MLRHKSHGPDNKLSGPDLGEEGIMKKDIVRFSRLFRRAAQAVMRGIRGCGSAYYA